MHVTQSGSLGGCSYAHSTDEEAEEGGDTVFNNYRLAGESFREVESLGEN